MSTPPDDVVDHAIVGQLRALAAVSSAPDLLHELLESFRETLVENLPAIELAVGNSDLQRTERLAHLIAGAAANLGLPLVNRAARSLELRARAGGDEDLTPLLDDLKRESAVGVDELARVIASG
jgi:HPt (histidine-containing phosphotransfer) domain-containing protein